MNCLALNEWRLKGQHFSMKKCFVHSRSSSRVIINSNFLYELDNAVVIIAIYQKKLFVEYFGCYKQSDGSLLISVELIWHIPWLSSLHSTNSMEHQ